ncbi:hypothetical protein HZC21_01140 [Candidatus Peregrinibacteria bacterium]|nr:hypothetical protein [Candidatus Peregrinibacteria bacterium]
MPFRLLKYIISHLRQKSTCSKCKNHLEEDSFFIIATAVSLENDGYSGLFFTVCPKCSSPAFISVEVKPVNSKTKKVDITISTKSAPKGITINDVLDMHNFLKSWKGSVEELFKQ